MFREILRIIGSTATLFVSLSIIQDKQEFPGHIFTPLIAGLFFYYNEHRLMGIIGNMFAVWVLALCQCGMGGVLKSMVQCIASDMLLFSSFVHKDTTPKFPALALALIFTAQNMASLVDYPLYKIKYTDLPEFLTFMGIIAYINYHSFIDYFPDEEHRRFDLHPTRVAITYERIRDACIRIARATGILSYRLAFFTTIAFAFQRAARRGWLGVSSAPKIPSSIIGFLLSLVISSAATQCRTFALGLSAAWLFLGCFIAMQWPIDSFNLAVIVNCLYQTTFVSFSWLVCVITPVRPRGLILGAFFSIFNCAYILSCRLLTWTDRKDYLYMGLLSLVGVPTVIMAITLRRKR